MDRSVSPLRAGLGCRCPACGTGPLFCGFLAIASACTSCGARFTREDAGDGPAFFVVVLAGMLIVPLALGLQVAIAPPVWLQILVWLPASLGLCLVLLRPFKALMFALQWRHGAAEARFETQGDRQPPA